MLALFPKEEEATISKEVLGALPEIAAAAVEEEPWVMQFDGYSTTIGRGAGVVPVNPEGQATALSFKLIFPCTNNVVEYEAFIKGLSTAREMGARKIRVVRDSNLVLSEVQGNFALKEITLAPYNTMAEKLMASFKQGGVGAHSQHNQQICRCPSHTWLQAYLCRRIT
ncbi:uncharacterized protein [Pyrus communis]|uniref:uncharacterized protein n=1 Tax=Pyrus communis TaxID=23211 RepID=UPI0035C0CB31